MNKLFQLKVFQISFSQKNDSSYRLNTLGPLCRWQCFYFCVKVDVFGKCGERNCGPANGGASNLECDAMIEKNYKFFLAFENSICTDYVTEKFFRTLSRYILTCLFPNIRLSKHLLDRNYFRFSERLIVPVVLGGANYTRLAPPGSYIK